MHHRIRHGAGFARRQLTLISRSGGWRGTRLGKSACKWVTTPTVWMKNEIAGIARDNGVAIRDCVR
jgi:hypothetical protein